MTDQIANNFRVFHKENPHVYAMFERFALQMATRVGVASAGLIFERMRWEIWMDTRSKPRLNNNYRAMYARLFEENHPDYAGLFRKRVRRAHTIDGADFDPEE